MDPVVKCHYCEKTFKKKVYCTKHVKNVHKINYKGEPVVELEIPYFTCVVCEKMFKKKNNLERHLNSVHLASSKNCKTYECDKCSHTCRDRGNLRKHILRVHERTGEKKYLQKKFHCAHCNSKFSRHSSLRSHERKQHQIEHRGQIERKCPLCLVTIYGKSKEIIHSHFQQMHDIKLNWEHHNFNSISEFEIWKQQIEKKTTCMYTKTSCKSNMIIFQCHRCGIYRTKGNNVRKIKSVGTCKINSFCPSVIKVQLKENLVSVQFLSTHVGHNNELKHIRLTAGKQRTIATQLRDTPQTEEEEMSNDTDKAIMEEDYLVDSGEFENIIIEEYVSSKLSTEKENNLNFEAQHSKLFETALDFARYLRKHVKTPQQVDFAMEQMNHIMTTIDAMSAGKILYVPSTSQQVYHFQLEDIQALTK